MLLCFQNKVVVLDSVFQSVLGAPGWNLFDLLDVVVRNGSFAPYPQGVKTLGFNGGRYVFHVVGRCHVVLKWLASRT